VRTSRGAGWLDSGQTPSTTGQRCAPACWTCPSIDHTAIARGFGVDAVRVGTADELGAALRRAYAEPGPQLIEAPVPPLL